MFTNTTAYWETHMDDDGLSGGIDVHLFGTSDVEISKITLQLLVGGLQIKKSLRPPNSISKSDHP